MMMTVSLITDESKEVLFMQLEGTYTLAIFRCSKAYRLENKTDLDHESVTRMRSIPRRHHKALENRHFNPDPRVNHLVVRGLQLMPSMGYEVVMSYQGRTLAKAYNLKRTVTVSFDIFTVEEGRNKKLIINFFVSRIHLIRWL